MAALDGQLRDAIARSKRDNRYRTLEPIDSCQGRTVSVDGEELLNFSSNDYLGLAGNDALRQAAHAAIERYGVGSGASALLSGRSLIHAELERRLAAFMRVEAALLYSSGYLANLGVIGTLVGRHDDVFQDRLNHASLIDAVALSRANSKRYRHADPAALRLLLERSSARRRWIITDTVFSMDGDIAPLTELSALAAHYGASLIGDDAHGFGVLGAGRGTAAELELGPDRLPVQVVTFGKALGTAGAAAVGSAQLIDALIQSSRTFIYDTAPPPALAAATLAALDLIETRPHLNDRLSRNIHYFRELAADLPLMPSRTPIQPLLIGDEKEALGVAAGLRQRGLYVRAIRPPTVPAGTARLRICISAAHTRADIDQLASTLRSSIGAMER